MGSYLQPPSASRDRAHDWRALVETLLCAPLSPAAQSSKPAMEKMEKPGSEKKADQDSKRPPMLRKEKLRTGISRIHYNKLPSTAHRNSSRRARLFLQEGR